MNLLKSLLARISPIPTHARIAADELEAARVDLLATETVLELWTAKRDAAHKRVRRLEQYVLSNPVPVVVKLKKRDAERLEKMVSDPAYGSIGGALPGSLRYVDGRRV